MGSINETGQTRSTRQNYEILLIPRIILGFSIGVASYVAPLYLSEMSEKEHRGRLMLQLSTLNLMSDPRTRLYFKLLSKPDNASVLY